MRAGRLRHRVRIQQGTPGRDGFGTEVLTWSDVATVWAEVRSVSGGEQTQANMQTFATASHQVTMRYRLGLSPKMRVLWGSRVLEILNAREPDNRMRMVQLNCVEVIDGQS